jgi:hypothetical protein
MGQVESRDEVREGRGPRWEGTLTLLGHGSRQQGDGQASEHILYEQASLRRIAPGSPERFPGQDIVPVLRDGLRELQEGVLPHPPPDGRAL